MFTCTVPPTRKSRETNWQMQHPRFWEFEVQQFIRALRPPRPDSPHKLRVGADAEGLAAVSYYEELDGPSDIYLHVGAVATRLRGKGGGYADEMIEDTLDAITAAAFAAGVTEVRVAGRIYESNRPSQEMVRRAGFRHVGNTQAPGVQIWSLDLLLLET